MPWTSTHLHGSASLPQFDGYASDITNPGEFKDYLYPNVQDARTLWYHDHGVHHTAENAYMGLAAQYHLHDSVEDGLPIPKGKYDCPLILADKMFDTDGQFMYDDAGHSGLWGDVVLTNGVPWPKMAVEPRKYRFRVLNASISRGYRLQLGNGEDFQVIGTDGGLMPAPATTKQLRIGMAERYEIVIDFAKFKGASIELRNLGVPNSTDYDNTGKIMRFDVGQTVTDTANNDVPAVLNPNKATMGLTEADEGAHDQAGGHTQQRRVADPQHGRRRPRAGRRRGRRSSARTTPTWCPTRRWTRCKIWEVTNKSGGWFHPVHIHLVDFKLLTRNGKPVFNYEQGPKDVMYVGENETIRAVMRFGERFAKPGGGYYSWADAGLTSTTDPEITGTDYRATGRYMIPAACRTRTTCAPFVVFWRKKRSNALADELSGAMEERRREGA